MTFRLYQTCGQQRDLPSTHYPITALGYDSCPILPHHESSNHGMGLNRRLTRAEHAPGQASTVQHGASIPKLVCLGQGNSFEVSASHVSRSGLVSAESGRIFHCHCHRIEGVITQPQLRTPNSSVLCSGMYSTQICLRQRHPRDSHPIRGYWPAALFMMVQTFYQYAHAHTSLGQN